MKEKKLLAILLILVMAVTLLTGCGSKDASSGTDETEKDIIVIGCTFDYVSDFMAYVADGAAAYQTDNPDAQVVILDANKDAAKQLKDVENLISQNVDAIVIKPVDSDACQPIIEACKEAGIPLINVNSKINSDDITCLVGSDNVLAGKLQAEYLAEQLGGKGNINILQGDPNNQDSRDRTQGNKDVLANYPDIKIGSEQVGKWMRDTGMQVTENWIQSKMPMDAILANNDEMAIGAALAAKETGAKILIAGVDATPDALNMLKEGTLTITVFQNGYQQGYVGVETAVKAAKGEEVEKYVDIPFELVTADKADEYLAKYEN